MRRRKWWNLGADSFNKGPRSPSPQQRMNPCCLGIRGSQEQCLVPCLYFMALPHCAHATLPKYDSVVLVFIPLVSLGCKVCSYFLSSSGYSPSALIFMMNSTIAENGNLRASPSLPIEKMRAVVGTCCS